MVYNISPSILIPIPNNFLRLYSRSISYLYGLSSKNLINKRAETINVNNTDTKIYEASYNLRDNAIPLSKTSSDSLFSTKSVTLENQNIISAIPSNDAVETTYKIEVQNLAASQVLVSNTLNSYIKYLSSNSINKFKIKLDGEIYEFSVKINPSETNTNKEIVEKIKNAINNKNIGIKAEIEKNYSANTVKLRLYGIKTGETHSFIIYDTQGNLLNNLGITAKRKAYLTNGGIESLAEDAEFYINGKYFTSDTNEVNLFDNTLKLTLQGVSKNPIEVKVKTNSVGIYNAISEFVKNFNTVLERISEDFSASSLRTYENMRRMLRVNKEKLALIGITIDVEGNLKINSKKLNENIENNFEFIKSTFTGLYGFASRMFYEMSRVIFSPLTFLFEGGENFNSEITNPEKISSTTQMFSPLFYYSNSNLFPATGTFFNANF